MSEQEKSYARFDALTNRAELVPFGYPKGGMVREMGFMTDMENLPNIALSLAETMACGYAATGIKCTDMDILSEIVRAGRTNKGSFDAIQRLDKAGLLWNDGVGTVKITPWGMMVEAARSQLIADGSKADA